MGRKAQVSIYLKMHQETAMMVGLLVEHSGLSQLSPQHHSSNAPSSGLPQATRN